MAHSNKEVFSLLEKSFTKAFGMPAGLIEQVTRQWGEKWATWSNDKFDFERMTSLLAGIFLEHNIEVICEGTVTNTKGLETIVCGYSRLQAVRIQQARGLESLDKAIASARFQSFVKDIFTSLISVYIIETIAAAEKLRKSVRESNFGR